jgi:oligoribonuclease NrnB/cAMP/cGMP phosphodiesterase (DHH superfamily)
MPEENFIEYSHGMELKPIDPDKYAGTLDSVYIVDLALDNVIYGLIATIRRSNPDVQIIHIDHHQTTFDFINNMDDDQSRIMSTVRKFYRNGISASLLCWVYCCMTDTDRARLDDESIPEGERDTFDFTENFTHVGFNPNQPGERIIRVPTIVRYIDDWDVWRHAITGTKEFNAGFGLLRNKHPKCKFWTNFLYTNNEMEITKQFLEPGRIIREYQTTMYQNMMKHAFEYQLPTGETILCLNADGTSMVFGDKINEYPACCLYNYEGDKKLWTYSMYSNDKGLDVSVICKGYGGGGHVHASGFQLPYNLFDNVNK